MESTLIQYLKDYFEYAKNLDFARRELIRNEKPEIHAYCKQVNLFFSTIEKSYEKIFEKAYSREPHHKIKFLKDLILKELEQDLCMNEWMINSKSKLDYVCDNGFCYINFNKMSRDLQISERNIQDQIEFLAMNKSIELKIDGPDYFFKIIS